MVVVCDVTTFVLTHARRVAGFVEEVLARSIETLARRAAAATDVIAQLPDRQLLTSDALSLVCEVGRYDVLLRSQQVRWKYVHRRESCAVRAYVVTEA